MRQSWQWTVVFAVGFRVLAQALLLERAAYSACWMTPLLGFALALPAVGLAARRWSAAGSTQLPARAAGYGLRGLALGYLLLDTAQMVLLFQKSGQFSSLSSYPTSLLFALLLVSSLFVIQQNRNGVFGVGAAIRSLLWIILGLLILFRIPEMHASRLFPLLGGGWRPLLLGGLSVAGIALQFLILLSVAPDLRPSPRAIPGMWAAICGGASALAAVETMLSAIVPPEQYGVVEALERLLASGRFSVSLQLPLYLAWFSVHFTVICVNLKCMAALAAELAHREESAGFRVMAVAAVAAAAAVGNRLLGSHMGALLQWPGALRYGALALAALLLWLPDRSNRRAVIS